MNVKTNQRLARSAGFTMIEILVVVVIIGILASIIGPQFYGKVGQAKASTAKLSIGELSKQIEMFKMDYDRLPDGLIELIERPADIDEAKWQAPMIKAKDLIDPWGHDFQYLQPGDHGAYDLWSYGADGEEGGEGDNADITNWE